MKLVFINHVHPDTPHVSAMRMYYFAKAMASRGHQVVLLTGESPVQPGHCLDASEITSVIVTHNWTKPLVLSVGEHAVSTRPQGAESLPPLIRRIRTAWRLLGGDGVHGQWVANAWPILEKIAEAFDPDLAWATFGNTSNLQLGQWLAQRVGCPWVADIKDNWYGYIPKGLRHAVAWRFRDAAGMTSNAWLHLQAAESWGKSKPKKVIYSGVAEAFYQVPANDQSDRFRDVLLVGSIRSTTKLHVLLSALKQWAEALPVCGQERLRLVYAGTDSRQFNEAVHQILLPCTVMNMGQRPLEELARMTQQSLMNCYLTSDVSFHHKLLELLVAGRPVVCFPREHPESRQLAGGSTTGFHECATLDELVTAFDTLWKERAAPTASNQLPAWRWDDFSVELEKFFASLVQTGREQRMS
ncbi:MAG: hypothetical protein WCX93_06260 [Burkholderiaceae bacterium]|uniref:hypothetical protein n=1 Tax=Denitratimonas sp. CY0512 TaxID=3131940 RepID=UPI0030979BD9